MVFSLLVLALLALIATSTTTHGRTSATIAVNAMINAQAKGLADGGVHYVAYRLSRRNFDSAQTPLPRNATPFKINMPDGHIIVTVQDETGKIDLNTAGFAMLESLFSAAGRSSENSQALAGAIIDWRDTDHARHPDGAEDSQYLAAGLAFGAKDSPFESVDELIHVLGMDDALMETVRPALTVFSGANRININVAPELVFRAIYGIPPSTNDTQDALEDIAKDRGMAAAASANQSSGFVYCITVIATTNDGGRFIREAIIELTGDTMPAYGTRLWRQGSKSHVDHVLDTTPLILSNGTGSGADDGSLGTNDGKPKGIKVGDEIVPAIY